MPLSCCVFETFGEKKFVRRNPVFFANSPYLFDREIFNAVQFPIDRNDRDAQKFCNFLLADLVFYQPSLEFQ